MDADEKAQEKAQIDQARAGSQPAFRALVERHQRRVYAVALAYLRDGDEARDVAQETFIRAYRGLPNFDGQSAFFTWLYRIATNLCIDRSRRDKRGASVEFDEGAGLDEQGGSGISPDRLGFDPERAVEDREIRERVLRSLGELSPSHRAVIVAREVEGLSYQEIAEAHGISQGTVMSRLFYARKRMQELCKELVVDGSEAQVARKGGGR